MAEKEFSPEERLLKIIKGELKPQPPGGGGAAEQSVTLPGPSRFRGLRLWLRGWGHPRLLAWLPRINQGLIVGLIGSAVVVIAGLLRPVGGAMKVPTGTESLPQLAALEAMPPPPTPAMELFSSRQLFRPSVQEGAAAPDMPAAPEAQEQLLRYTLIGIMSGPSPQAVVEDVQTHKTSFLSVGDSLGDTFRVEQILESKVVLSAGDGNAYELRL